MSKRTPSLKVVKGPSSELAGLVDDRLVEMRAQGLSGRTLAINSDVLNRVLLPWLAEQGVTTADAVTRDTLTRFSAHLLEHVTPAGRPLARASVRTYLRVTKAFIKWVQARGDGEFEGLKVSMPPDEERQRQVLTRREIDAMEQAATSSRDKLLIRVLADSGCRLGEVLNLRREDLVKTKGETALRVIGKGNKQRTVPIDPSTFNRLEKYAKRPQSDTASTERIFTTERAKNGQVGPLNERTVQQSIAFIARAAGIERRVHPHLFRHSFATWQVDMGTPLTQIANMLGHNGLSMLAKTYSHSSQSTLFESYLKALRKSKDADRD